MGNHFVGTDVLLEQIRNSHLLWEELPQWMRNAAIFACALPPIPTAKNHDSVGNDIEDKIGLVLLHKNDQP